MDRQDTEHTCTEVANRMMKVQHLERPSAIGARDTLFRRGRQSLVTMSLDVSSLIMMGK